MTTHARKSIAMALIMAVALLGILISFNLYMAQSFAQEGGREHQGPPPEAYTACEEKSAGDTAEFQSPFGDTVTGTCEAEGDRLVLRPDNPPADRRQGPKGD
jgi:hypothetical protein